MDSNEKKPLERRSAVRISCKTPFFFKIVKEETLSKILEGYVKDISRGGVRCNINNEVPIGCTLWLKLDADTLSLCEEIEKHAVILQHGVLGKVIWADKVAEDNYDIGLQFLTREEKEHSSF